jgi:hypothetical protein
VAEDPLPDEIDELLWSELAEQRLTERLWESGDQPIDIDQEELVRATRAFNRGVRAALLRLAEEVEELKAQHEALSPHPPTRG